ncbi:MAG: hypothetical protein K6T57_09780 [Thermaceae bacterium]|nr:hypothetical protein [Thermaceae bacterium]
MPRLLAFGLLLLSLAFAQFDPRQAWYTISTPHFNLHYPEGLERVASEAALYAEDAYATLVAEFGEAPGTINLVLSDQGDYTNGFADPITNTVGIYTSQIRLSDSFNVRLPSWWQTVIFHEIVHAVDLNQKRGDWRDRTRIFGRIPSPNALKPIPLVEGLAVYMKYKFLGESRLNDSQTRMVIRQMVLEGKLPTLDEVRQYYSKKTWPTVGFLVYNYGAWLVRYLEVRFGSDAVRRFTEVNAGLSPLKDFNEPFQKAFGLSLEQIYAEFVGWLPHQFEDEIARIRAAGVTPVTRLTNLGFYAQFPSDAAAGLIYSHYSPLRAGLRLRLGDEEREILNGGIDMAQWAPDGRSLVFISAQQPDSYRVISDMYRLELSSGNVQPLTKGQRVYYARYAPDGKSLYIAQNTPDGSSILARYFLDLKRIQPLRDFPNQDGLIQSFAVAPDGKSLVLALLRRGGFQDLYRYVPDTGELIPLTQDQNVDSDPTFSPDGRYVIYSSDPDRVYNLYAYRLEDGAVFQVTNLLGGAFMPTVSRDRQHLIFSGYDSTGYNLYQIPYAPSSWRPVKLPRQGLPAFTPFPPAQGEPYDPLRYLEPPYWTPVFGLSSDALGLSSYAGVSLFGTDPIGIHAYTATAGYDSAGGLLYDLGYRYGGLGQPLSLRLWGMGPQNVQALGVGFYAPGGGLEAQYTRSALWEPTLDPQHPTVTHAFSLGLYSLNSSAADLFRAQSQISMVGTAFVRPLDGQWRARLQGSLGYAFRLPTESSHVFTLRAAGGLTTSPLAVDAFDLGVLPFSPTAFPALSLRGYPPGELVGSQAVAFSLQYRLPPWSLERGLGEWPLFFDDLSLSLFADAGTAGSPLSLSNLRYSLGAELRLDTTLFYALQGAYFSLGVAQGLGQPGPRFYALLNLPLVGIAPTPKGLEPSGPPVYPPWGLP